MKKRIGITAVILAAGCAILATGCAGNTQNVVYLSSNWYANTGYKKIQPTFTEEDEKFSPEKIIYDVKHDKTSADNDNYSVEYADGTYTTEFYAVNFDKNSEYVAEEYRSGYPEKQVVYCYKTELSIPSVTFIYGTESKVFDDGDKVITESYFLSVENRLRPLYSYQKINSVSPNMLNPKSLEECYSKNSYEYKTYYSYDGKSATTHLIGVDAIPEDNFSNKKNFDLNLAPSTFFDVSYLDVAVRANRLSADLAEGVCLITPSSGLQNFILRGGVDSLSDKEKSAAQEVLKKKGLYTPKYYKDEDGNEKEKGLSTVAVRVSYNGELTGVLQTYWISAIENARNNTGRATIVRMDNHVTFKQGILRYSIKEVKSTLWIDK